MIPTIFLKHFFGRREQTESERQSRKASESGRDNQISQTGAETIDVINKMT